MTRRSSTRWRRSEGRLAARIPAPGAVAFAILLAAAGGCVLDASPSQGDIAGPGRSGGGV